MDRFIEELKRAIKGERLPITSNDPIQDSFTDGWNAALKFVAEELIGHVASSQ